MKEGDRIYDLLMKRYGIVVRTQKGGVFYSDMHGHKHYAPHGEYSKPKRRAGEKTQTQGELG